jgi:hypothetical protein
MAASGSDTVSVVERTGPITISGGIVAVYFRRPAAFVLGEEAIMMAPPERFLLMRGL